MQGHVRTPGVELNRPALSVFSLLGFKNQTSVVSHRVSLGLPRSLEFLSV